MRTGIEMADSFSEDEVSVWVALTSSQVKNVTTDGGSCATIEALGSLTRAAGWYSTCTDLQAGSFGLDYMGSGDLTLVYLCTVVVAPNHPQGDNQCLNGLFHYASCAL